MADPTGTETLVAGLQAFSSGYAQFQTETRANFDKLWVWAEGLSLAVTDVQEGLATVHADMARLQNDMDVRLTAVETGLQGLRDDMDEKFAVLFKHLGIQ